MDTEGGSHGSERIGCSVCMPRMPEAESSPRRAKRLGASRKLSLLPIPHRIGGRSVSDGIGKCSDSSIWFLISVCLDGECDDAKVSRICRQNRSEERMPVG